MLRTGLGVVICLVTSVGLAQAQGGKKGTSNDAPADVAACEIFSGGTLNCSCPANGRNGSVWGSGPYTGDSDICTAARHAGAIGGSGGVIDLLERPGQASYTGSSANGVTTSDWGSYGQSYEIASSGGAEPVSNLPACGQMPSDADEHVCNCPANAPAGSVWGNGPYTADSDICTAAIHNGYLDTDGGDVYVLSTQGLETYTGAESFGITSSDWGAYGTSINFDWNR